MNRTAYGPNNSGYVKTYYIRKGKTMEPMITTKERLRNFIKDDQSLLEDFESLYKRSYPFKSIVEILEQYNQLQIQAIS